MKLALGVPDLSGPYLEFAAQYGVTHLKVGGELFMDESRRGPFRRALLAEAVERAAGYGLSIGVVLIPQGRNTMDWNIRLGAPGREGEITDVCRSIEAAGGEGIPVIEYVFNLFGNWRPAPEPHGRGGAVVSWFDREAAGKAPEEPSFGAPAEEVWERITWFLERVVPAAEKAGVRLACHPDDPPVPSLRGETRVLCTIEGLKRLVETVPSESNGLNFCQGTVAEMGADVIEAIRYFGSRGKINHVHFRNVNGTLPRFDESFIDDGDVNMLEAMRAYKEVGYRGTIIPDHVPRAAGDSGWCPQGRAFALGYMRALMQAAGV